MAILNGSEMGLSTITTVLMTLFAGAVVRFLFLLYKQRRMMSGLVSLLSICLRSCQLNVASRNHHTAISLAT